MRHRRRRTREHQNHDRWLVSYADFITLMFAFFVVMFSSAQVDKRKVGQLAHEMQIVFRDGLLPGGASLSYASPVDNNIHGDRVVNELEKELQSSLSLEIANKSIALRSRPDGLVISLREAGFFESGSATPKPQAASALESIAASLATRTNGLCIEGHTDNVPIHTGRYASNWELSTARSTEIVKFFIEGQHFSPQRISAAGFAEFHPAAGNETPEGRAANRRVDIVVLRN